MASEPRLTGRDAATHFDRRDVLKLSGAGLAASLAGCFDSGGDGGSGGGGGGEVNFISDYGNQAWQSRWEDELIPGFEEDADATISIEYVGNAQDLRNRVATLVQAGDPPELVTALLSDVGKFVPNDQAYPLSDVVADMESELGSLPDNYRDKISIKGEQYIAPHGLMPGNILHYRSDVYEELGLEEPRDWNHLLENCQAIADSDLDIMPASVSGVKGGGKSNNDNIGWMRCSGGGTWQWKSDAQEEIEPWLPEEPTNEALRFQRDFAEFSPDPSSEDWGPALQHYAGGQVAHAGFFGGYGLQAAMDAGADEVVENTEVMAYPLREEGLDVRDRGYLLVDGYYSLRSDSNEAAADFVRDIHRNQEQAALNFHPEPARLVPVFESVLNSDTYQNAPAFQEYPVALEKARKISQELSPMMGSAESLYGATHTRLIGNATIITLSNMVNRVLVQGMDPDESRQMAISELEEHAAEANETMNEG